MKGRRSSQRPPRRSPPENEAFAIDDEAASLAEEFIAEATSAEHVAEDARDEPYLEETTPLYNVDFTALDEP